MDDPETAGKFAQEEIEYNIINIKFRDNWNLGMKGEIATKSYFNSLVKILQERNELITTDKILKMILNENCDLPAISYWKLKDNLDKEIRQR